MKIGNDFEVTRDASGWTLFHYRSVEDRKTKQFKRVPKPSYYASLEQCCNQILDRSAAHADTAQEVIDAIHEAKREIIKAIKAAEK